MGADEKDHPLSRETEQLRAKLEAKLAQSEFFKRLRAQALDPEAIARAKREAREVQRARELIDYANDRPRRMEKIARQQADATRELAEALRQQAPEPAGRPQDPDMETAVEILRPHPAKKGKAALALLGAELVDKLRGSDRDDEGLKRRLRHARKVDRRRVAMAETKTTKTTKTTT